MSDDVQRQAKEYIDGILESQRRLDAKGRVPKDVVRAAVDHAADAFRKLGGPGEPRRSRRAA
jgi:hypothetical protein